MQRLVAYLLLICLSTVAVPLQAQNSDEQTVSPTRPSIASSRGLTKQLPDAPGAVKQPASVSGTVLDPSGAAVRDAKVTLTIAGKLQGRTVVSGTDGRFMLRDVAPGTYLILIEVKGFQSAASAKFTVAPHQTYEMPSVTLTIATVTTEVVVQPTAIIAGEQIKAEEKQRAFGIIPNFYTSYVWNAAPLDTKQKYSLAVRSTFDPMTFIGVSLGAGIEQATNTFPGYGQGGEGYAKRWGALFANGRTTDILSRAVFPSLFHQDPRYFYQGSGSTWSRAKHAVAYAFVARSDSGRLMPNYSYFLGDLCSGAISNVYYPASSRGASLVFANAAIGIAGRVGRDLVREFVFKKITTDGPGSGKPVLDRGDP